MKENNAPDFTLRFHPSLWLVALLVLAWGLIADWLWLAEFFTDHVEYPQKVKLLSVMFPIVAAFISLLIGQVVRVYPDRIESSHYGVFRSLDRASWRILKITANGYVITDDSGTKITIHKLMTGSNELFDLITR